MAVALHLGPLALSPGPHDGDQGGFLRVSTVNIGSFQGTSVSSLSSEAAETPTGRSGIISTRFTMASKAHKTPRGW